MAKILDTPYDNRHSMTSIIFTRAAMPPDDFQSASSAEVARNHNSLRRLLFSPFGRTFFSGVLLWLAFPPVGLAWLAWLAPIPLLSLIIAADENDAARTSVVRPRVLRLPAVQVWLASLIFWLVTFYFIPLPHPILFIGWIALSAYLAVFTPLMLAVAGQLKRWRISPLIAIPIAWTGLEWIRINFLTGFGMVALSHSQYSNPLVIQIADLSGAYTVTFAMTAFAAAATYCCYSARRAKGLIGCVVIAALVAGYGAFRLNQVEESKNAAPQRVALIQTSIDTILKPKTEAQILDELGHLRDINWAAREAHDSIDLIVWPESSYPYGNYVAEEGGDEMAIQSALISQANLKEVWLGMTSGGGRFAGVPTIIGTSTIDRSRQEIFNSAVLLNNTGAPVDRYDKHHRVMFGEYVPVLEHFPLLMRHLPINTNLTPGTEARLFESGGIKIAPNICFESTVPHLIRRQLNSISQDQGEPDVLLNITNDGWFFGTSCLDLHYACNVFRAVEMRKPMLVCANTGLSAHIDPWGVARSKGQRRAAEFLICEIDTDRKYPTALYRKIGDVIPMLLGLICIAAMVAAWWQKRTGRNTNLS